MVWKAPQRGTWAILEVTELGQEGCTRGPSGLGTEEHEQQLGPGVMLEDRRCATESWKGV